MRNDARPIGEEFRDIAEHDPDQSPSEHGQDAPARAKPESKPFVVNRNPDDDAIPADASER